ncbi:N-6 DNA methylase [Lachnospiraceae bacterium 54-53]
MSADTLHIHDEATRKRIGQYFTKKEIASLMVDVADMPINAVSIDPMCGTGNMLSALIEKGYDTENIYGIDIDSKAVDICNLRNGLKNIICGDAFYCKSYNNKLVYGVDFVITNPPYIRYQNINSDSPIGINLPDANKIRKELLKTVGLFKHLTKADKETLIHLIKTYSGLSDIAVPAWLLCAALLREGGKMAIVVPDTWLNRDYAVSIQYLLLKWFDIEYILEDVSRSWFIDAQVKTIVLIAKRRKSISSLRFIEKKSYKHVKICSSLQPELESINVRKSNIEIEFDRIWRQQAGFKDGYYDIRDEYLSNMKSNVLANLEKLKGIEGDKDKTDSNVSHVQLLPSDMKRVLLNEELELNLASLEEGGIHVGQGLRTGANKFFYLKLEQEGGEFEYLRTSSYFNEKIIKVPKIYSSRVLQKQSDLPGVFLINSSQVYGRVLYIQKAITSRDFNISANDTQQYYQTLDGEIEEYIIQAENLLIEGQKAIPELSAVKPNARFVKDNNKLIQRFWYMLPRYTSRHIPDFCVARINDGEPKFYMLAERAIVVDANFSTIWIDDQTKKYAYLAILNSLWVKAYLGCISTVMGGGALKVEASHIKKVLIPKFDEDMFIKLSHLGEKLISVNDENKSKALLNKIDQIILQYILKKMDVEKEYLNLYELVKSQINERKKK